MRTAAEHEAEEGVRTVAEVGLSAAAEEMIPAAE